MPGVEDPENFQETEIWKIRIGRKADTEVSQVKPQEHDQNSGVETKDPAPDQRKQ